MFNVLSLPLYNELHIWGSLQEVMMSWNTKEFGLWFIFDLVKDLNQINSQEAENDMVLAKGGDVVEAQTRYENRTEALCLADILITYYKDVNCTM